MRQRGKNSCGSGRRQVVNLQVAMNAGNFLTSTGNITLAPQGLINQMLK